MDFNYFFDDNINTIFIQKTYGKLMLTVGFMIVCALQLDIVVGNFYGQTACLVVGMVFIKLAHLATHAGIFQRILGPSQLGPHILHRGRCRDHASHRLAL